MLLDWSVQCTLRVRMLRFPQVVDVEQSSGEVN